MSLFYVIINFHNSILDNKIDIDYIINERNKTMFDKPTFNFKLFIKSIYKNIYYPLNNIYTFLTYKNFGLDKEYMQELLSKQDLDMTELRNKTEEAYKLDKKLYFPVVRWISGNCWLNSLVTSNLEHMLIDLDKEIIYSINNMIKLVKPMEKPLILFHGFEILTNYGENKFQINQIFNFPGILSKTSKFDIARGFANSQNIFQPKFLVVLYPPGSKHIGLDIKQPKYDEYEYIGKSGENFKLIKICKVFNGLQIQVFYICESLDY